jgi:hypothetical protein
MANTITPSGPVARVLARVQGVRRNGTGWTARCPAHDDRTPSLSIAQGDDGRVLLKCHAGCTHKEIAAALGIEERELFPPTEAAATPSRPPRPPREFDSAAAGADAYRTTHGPEAAKWVYHDAQGKPIGLVMRWNRKDGTKDYRPVWRFGDRWRLTYPDVRPLYALDRLAAAPGGRVFVVEGEKCAEMLWTLGLPATTSPGGSNAARQGDWSPLTGREVAVLPDADDPGRKYAAEVLDCLAKLDPPLKACTVALPGLRHREDVVEFVGRVHGGDHAEARKAIEELAESALAGARVRAKRIMLGALLDDPGLLKPPETIASGWAPWDKVQPFGAVERATVHVLAAPPGCYKTSTMLRMARGYAECGHRVAWLAGEMSPKTLFRRMLCQAAGLGQDALSSGAMQPEDERKFASARERLVALRDRIEFVSAPIGFAELKQAADSAAVVFVDYLQLVRHPEPSVRGHERIEDIMARLTELSQRTGATFVVAAAQGREGGGERRGIHNATRGSSSIEYSADAIYCAEEPAPKERRSQEGFEVEFVCLKQREGKRDVMCVPIDGRTGSIAEEVRR